MKNSTKQIIGDVTTISLAVLSFLAVGYFMYLLQIAHP